MELIAEATNALERIRVLNLTHVLFDSPAEMKQIEAQRQAEIGRLGQLETALDNVAEPALRPLIDSFFTKTQSFIDLSEKTIGLSAFGRKAEATRWAHDAVTPAYTAAYENSLAIRNDIKRHNSESLYEIRQTNRKVLLILDVGLLWGLALATLRFLFGLKRVLAPINSLTRAARRVSAGDYDVVLEPAGPDEAGVMSAAFNEMIRNQKKHIHELHGLLEVSEIVSSSLELTTVLKWVLTSGYLLGAEEGVVLLPEPDGTEAYFATDDNVKLCACVISTCIRPAMEDLRPQLTTIGEGDGECKECLAALGFRSVLAIPMRTHRQQVGCLLFFTRQEGFNAHELQLATLLGNQAAVAIENARLYSSLCDNYRNTISALALALGAKSEHTGQHGEHVVRYGEQVAVRLGLLPEDVQLVREGCLLHDVGKIGVPDEILKKPKRLTPEEYEDIKKHSEIGASIIAPPTVTHGQTGKVGPSVTQDPTRHLGSLALIVRHHHERFDGTGYPDGLKGEEIPLAARIVTVVDAFEAMTSDRPYRKAMPFQDAIRELRRCAGTQFDPEAVEAFLSVVMEQAEGGEVISGPLDGSVATAEPSPAPLRRAGRSKRG